MPHCFTFKAKNQRKSLTGCNKKQSISGPMFIRVLEVWLFLSEEHACKVLQILHEALYMFNDVSHCLDIFYVIFVNIIENNNYNIKSLKL